MMMDHAKVYVDGGHMFGPEGQGFVRMNVACRRQTLEQALARIRQAVSELKAG
jgi:cystathionine beta-lyase